MVNSWIKAVQEWKQDKPKHTLVPKKGTPEYDQVRKLQEKYKTDKPVGEVVSKATFGKKTRLPRKMKEPVVVSVSNGETKPKTKRTTTGVRSTRKPKQFIAKGTFGEDSASE